MIDKSLGNILEVLRRAALRDGLITEDEDRIISSVTWNLAQFQQVAEEAEDDGIITSSEREKIDFFSAQIIRDSKIISLRDGVITDDEAFLLKVIYRIVESFDY